MPRIYRTPRESERSLVREFVHYLGYKLSAPKWQDRPDALVTLRKGKATKRTGIEVTHHYNDTIAGKMSPKTPIGEFWVDVELSLMRRISHRKHLTGLLANVEFREEVALPGSKNRGPVAKALAAEIVKFAEANPIKPGQMQTFTRIDLTGYSTIERLLDSLILNRVTDEILPASRYYWTCANITTGHVAVNLDYIKSAIAAKNKKAPTYPNWGNAQEKWLLIVAGGDCVSTHASRRDIRIDWCDPALIQLCQNSPFDGIVFWERVGRWHRWLKK